MEKRIIEINGVKLEIDLREAKTVDTFKVGDTVKVLKKKYSDSYESHPGTIVGFDEFKVLPTIIVAYLEISYSECALKFEYINAETKNVEIVKANELDLQFEQATVMEKFDREIEKKEREIEDIKSKRNYFSKHFGKYFVNLEPK
jgi:hypothetical protein